ncbi:MAG: hypothetical protein DA330_08835 [Nitrososphaera sp.]|nr:hypothetical protein [Nitrososphaera sp.]
MNSIDIMEAEISSQIHDLPKIQMSRLDDVVFVGSGDSFVAGLAACYFGNASCHSPADIIANPALAQNKTVCIVSVSGKTEANILAAEAARSAGARTIALTASKSSRLAESCDRSLELKYSSAGKSAGTISFTASMLACIMLASEARCPANLQEIYSQAAAKTIDAKESFVLLGDGVMFPAAMYLALKLNEVFGAKAHAYPVEEFCHAPIFGVKADDRVVIFGKGDRDKRLSDRLSQAGIDTMFLDCTKDTKIESLFYAVFVAQHLILNAARKAELADCYFLANRKLLDISSEFIYQR